MVREVFELDLVVERHDIIDLATERLCLVILIDSEALNFHFD